MSANLAYGEVKLESTGLRGELYEEPGRLVRSDHELTEHSVTTNSPPAAPVYDTVDGERTSVRNKHQLH